MEEVKRNMINFARLLDWRFWFVLRPSALGEKTAIVVAVGFVALLVAAIILNFLAKTKKQNPPLVKLFKKIGKMFSTMALIGFVLLFFSYEQIYFLGSHLWFLLWLAGFVVWTVFIVLYALRGMRREKEELEKKQRFMKYLPH